MQSKVCICVRRSKAIKKANVGASEALYIHLILVQLVSSERVSANKAK